MSKLEGSEEGRGCGAQNVNQNEEDACGAGKCTQGDKLLRINACIYLQ
jgi:hypothetical protein